MSNMTQAVDRAETCLLDCTDRPATSSSLNFVQKLQLNNPVFWLSGSFLLPMVDWAELPQMCSQWSSLIILGVVNTGSMYVIIYDAFHKLSTHLIAILSFVYPVTALMVDYLAFGNTVNLWQGVGVIAILLAACAVKFNWRVSVLLPTVKRQQKI